MTKTNRALAGLRAFFSGGGFAAFGLALLMLWECVLLGILFVPAEATGLGRFAEEFRVWCYGYDPATGRANVAYVLSMTVPQLGIAALLLLFWWQPLREVLARPRALLGSVGAAVALVAVSALGFALIGGEPARGELPFPAEALRTSYVPPELELVDQRGELVDLAALRGKVVVLTAVYASCPHTCPAVLAQAKSAIEELDEADLEDLRLVAVTMDPENDSPERLAALARGHGMEAPVYHLVTGPADEVDRVLDRMQVARRRDPETGIIDHANLFLLVDREGRLAYRFGLGERQGRWLASALRLLLREEPTPG